MSKDTIYEVLYCPHTWESAFTTVSLHRTKQGAEKAMEEHKEETRKEVIKRCHEMYNVDEEEEMEEMIKFKLTAMRSWKIRERKIFE